MASIYSKQLFAGTLPTSSTTVLFTAAANVTTIIRDISLTAFGGTSPFVVELDVNGVHFHTWENTAPFEDDHVNCRVVLNAGDIVSATTSTGGIQGVLSGYELSS